ncbi:alpha-L-rhamnosidase [Schaalia vaccimaxillae]|uniref:alpha-L-rhamnosidase n=1 Tax=Schaalia vaccimaxillae TaxID=183916 RepID=UPI0003B57B39|nr:alpha-L-rhamnosidase [Schaalia vaccimaxillae]
MPTQSLPIAILLRAEHLPASSTVIGIASPAPRLSWQVEGAAPGWTQTGYEIEVTREGSVGTFPTDGAAGKEQILVPWPTSPLASREQVTVRVRLAGGTDTDAQREWGPWSDPVILEAALLDERQWRANFISPVGIGGMGQACPVMGTVVELPDDVKIVRARLRSTAHGIYTIRLNGENVDDSVLNPGWTAYQHRIQYITQDVTERLVHGTNIIEATIADGWYRGTVGYYHRRCLYGDRLALLAQLEVELADGTLLVFGSDESWRAWESPVISADLYHGQETDLRLASAPVDPRDEATTHPVEVVARADGHLVPLDVPRIRPTAILTCQRIWTSPSGRTLLDFGQNAVGWLRIKVRGLDTGTVVVARHAEVIEYEELGVRPLRAARATDTWIIADEGEHVLEPEFTLHGFRYAEVSGIADLSPEDIEFVVIGSDMVRRGWFDCSDADLTRLHENVVWSTKSNFVSIPTDCPQRDERLGWTGDIQVFAPTACFLFDTASFLSSWLNDLAAEQYPDGGVPHVIPTFTPELPPDPAAAAWGDAAVVVPWTLYQRTGDIEILRRQMESMAAWVDRITDLAGPGLVWSGGFQYGDWLDPTAPTEEPAMAKADPDLVATACFARCAQITATAAETIGDAYRAAKYSDLASQIRVAFNEAFVSPQGRVHSDSQTGYAMAICWDLLPTQAQRSFAGARLADLVRLADHRIGTGFVGTPLICDALTASGHEKVAMNLLEQKECPSWLYPVRMGATTIWERWDSMLPDGTINPGGMTSFNHYALGAIADWMHRVIAGLDPTAPGYRTIRIAPHCFPQLTGASAQHDSPYGTIRSQWAREDDRIRFEVEIPVGVEAQIILPSGAASKVGHGVHVFHEPLTQDSPDDAYGGDAVVRDVLDDVELWQQICSEVNRNREIPVTPDQLMRMLRTYLDFPASVLPHVLTPFPANAPEGQIPRLEALLREGGFAEWATPISAERRML